MTRSDYFPFRSIDSCT